MASYHARLSNYEAAREEDETTTRQLQEKARKAAARRRQRQAARHREQLRARERRRRRERAQEAALSRMRAAEEQSGSEAQQALREERCGGSALVARARARGFREEEERARREAETRRTVEQSAAALARAGKVASSDSLRVVGDVSAGGARARAVGRMVPCSRRLPRGLCAVAVPDFLAGPDADPSPAAPTVLALRQSGGRFVPFRDQGRERSAGGTPRGRRPDEQWARQRLAFAQGGAGGEQASDAGGGPPSATTSFSSAASPRGAQPDSARSGQGRRPRGGDAGPSLRALRRTVLDRGASMQGGSERPSPVESPRAGRSAAAMGRDLGDGRVQTQYGRVLSAQEAAERREALRGERPLGRPAEDRLPGYAAYNTLSHMYVRRPLPASLPAVRPPPCVTGLYRAAAQAPAAEPFRAAPGQDVPQHHLQVPAAGCLPRRGQSRPEANAAAGGGAIPRGPALGGR